MEEIFLELKQLLAC